MRHEAGIDSHYHRLSDRSSPISVAEAEEEVAEETVAVVVDSKWKSQRSDSGACGLGKRVTKKRSLS